MTNFEGRGVLVVGASAGIGRATAVRAVQAGAEVLLTARRRDRLDEAVSEAGGGHLLVADISSEDDCRRIADEAVAVLPQIDLVLIAAGMAPLAPLTATAAEQWATTMQTNVIGINRCIAALVPHLAPAALVAACSSETAHAPRWGLGAYAASKAALETSLKSWRIEHPAARFTCIAVGATMPTDFGSSFERDTLHTAFTMWAAQGMAQAEMMETGDVATVILDTLGAVLPHPGVGLEELLLRSPSPLVDGATGQVAGAEADGNTS